MDHRGDRCEAGSRERVQAALSRLRSGGQPPFGNLYDLPTYVDQSLARQETVVVQAGTHTDTIALSYADYERLVKPRVALFGEVD